MDCGAGLGSKEVRPAGVRPKRAGSNQDLGEISRFWRDFGIPDQVIVMQRHYNQTWERHHEGSHNLWAFKVLSNIFPVSRFLKSAPSSETFVAFDLARQALDKFTPQEDFGRNLAIAAYALSEGVAADLDIVHADGRDLLRMVRGQGRGPASALGSGAAAGVPKSEEEQLRNALAQQDYLHARAARASVTMAAVQVEKERMEDERT